MKSKRNEKKMAWSWERKWPDVKYNEKNLIICLTKEHEVEKKWKKMAWSSERKWPDVKYNEKFLIVCLTKEHEVEKKMAWSSERKWLTIWILEWHKITKKRKVMEILVQQKFFNFNILILIKHGDNFQLTSYITHQTFLPHFTQPCTQNNNCWHILFDTKIVECQVYCVILIM